MKLRSLLGLMTMIALINIGCSKDNDDNGSGKTEAISSAGWKFSTATVGGVDFSSQIPACQRDNIVTFAANNTGTVAEGTMVCDPSTAGNFTWQFTEQESKLTTSTAIIPGGNGEFNIVTLNATTMVLSQATNLIPSPIPVTITVTLVHP